MSESSVGYFRATDPSGDEYDMFWVNCTRCGGDVSGGYADEAEAERAADIHQARHDARRSREPLP